MKSKLLEWLKTCSYEEFRKYRSQNAELSLPIDGVPLSGAASGSKEEYRLWKSAVDKGQVRELFESEFEHVVTQTANKDIVEAWKGCVIEKLKRKHSKTGFVEEVDSEGSATVLFTLRYVPLDLNHSLPVVKTFTIDGATAHPPLASGMQIPFAGVSMMLKRAKRSAIVIVVNTDKGSFSTKIDEIPIDPGLMSLKVEKLPPDKLAAKIEGPSDGFNEISEVNYTISTSHRLLNFVAGAQYPARSTDSKTQFGISFSQHGVEGLRAKVHFKHAGIVTYTWSP